MTFFSLGSIAFPITRLSADPGVCMFDSHVGHITSEIDHEIFYNGHSTPLLIQEGHLSVLANISAQSTG